MKDCEMVAAVQDEFPESSLNRYAGRLAPIRVP